MLIKEELTPHALELFRRLKEALPLEIAERLRSSRGFYTHSSYRTLFLFDIWDRNQNDVLGRQHFKYCLGSDRRPRVKRDSFCLWFSRSRIYRNREAILEILDRELPRAKPKEFIWRKHDRAFEFAWEFDYPEDLSNLPELLLLPFVRLVSAIHPILMPIIDQFTTPLEPGERRKVVAERGRIAYTHPGVHDRARVQEYTRSVRPSLRRQILEQHNWRCALCPADLRRVKPHIDHIKPFSKGGTTTPDNLQALCGPCNLAKGNREY